MKKTARLYWKLLTCSDHTAACLQATFRLPAFGYRLMISTVPIREWSWTFHSMKKECSSTIPLRGCTDWNSEPSNSIPWQQSSAKRSDLSRALLPVSSCRLLQLTPADYRPYRFDNTVTDTVEIIVKKYHCVRITWHELNSGTDLGL